MSDTVDALIAETEDLIALIHLENERLVHERPSALSELIATKNRVALNYEQLVKRVRQNPLLLRSAPKQRILDLRASLARFEDAMQQNSRLLLKLKSAKEGLLRAIAAELNPQNQRAPIYTSGKLAPDRRSAAALSINAVV